MAKEDNVIEMPKGKSATEILAELQIAQYQEAKQKKTDEEERMKRFRLMNALEAKKRKEEMEAMQAICNHRKPNNRTAIVGYRSHDHVENFICQNCFLEWHGGEVPAMLRPPREQVGGPI